MNRAAPIVATVLLGSLLVAAAPAAADDVERCASEATPSGSATAGACVRDTTEGDPGGPGTDCRDYRGFTGATAEAGAAAAGADAGSYHAAAGGEEDCHTFSDYQAQGDRVFAQAEAESGPAQSSFVLAQWSSDELGVYLLADPSSGFVFASGEARGGAAGCVSGATLAYGAAGQFGGGFLYQTCPGGGPPDSPNPGWGEAVP